MQEAEAVVLSKDEAIPPESEGPLPRTRPSQRRAVPRESEKSMQNALPETKPLSWKIQEADCVAPPKTKPIVKVSRFPRMEPFGVKGDRLKQAPFLERSRSA